MVRSMLVPALVAVLGSAPAAGQSSPPAPASDLDAFMARVLDRREANRRTLNDYILSEVETFELLGPGRVPMYRFKREYAWYVREGLHVRSPVKVDGVTISEVERR